MLHDDMPTPANLMAWFSAGVAAHQMHHFDEAIRYFRKILSHAPAHQDTRFNLAKALADQGNLEEAGVVWRALQLANPTDLAILTGFAQHLIQCARYDEVRQVVHALPVERWDYGVCLVVADAAIGNAQYAEALPALGRAIQLAPERAAAFQRCAVVSRKLGDFTGAFEFACAATARSPADPAVLLAHANAASALGYLDIADAALLKILAIVPDYVWAWVNLGILRHRQAQYLEAMAAYDRALEIQPELVAAHWNRALTLLTLGRYAEGWQEYEWRHAEGGLMQSGPQTKVPVWQGEPLAGKRIWLYWEQGQGDTIQCLRFIPLLKAQGATIILDVQASLRRLVEAQGWDVEVRNNEHSRLDNVPLNIDFHLPMMSLMLVFNVDRHLVPGGDGYLLVPNSLQAAWKARLSESAQWKMGLVWAGGIRPGQPEATLLDARRSMGLAPLMPLANFSQITWVTLQQGSPAHEAALLKADWLRDWMPLCDDFLETAGLIMALDAVVTVDTAVAHLAGALGKPVWLLDRFDHDWRWLIEARHAPWYPTITVLRQAAPGDWDGVVQQLIEELKIFCLKP